MTDALDALSALLKNGKTLVDEIETLRLVEEWAREQVGVAPGDQVVIGDSFPPITMEKAPGWWQLRHCLVPGALAEVVSVEFSRFRKDWTSVIRLDSEWNLRDDGTVAVYQGFSKHTFYVSTKHLRLRTPDDRGIPQPPADVVYGAEQ